ncbi:hypothetical protein AAES_69835 [Amazona aestiva]|uniref:Uncharacterized protein n=1 Tax=Amazona aestiva TaxID=12930 RepID=A0A0Q3PNB6_AMAAE|nr:hypothetical protein AAES_69835 [Amazona aestiva]
MGREAVVQSSGYPKGRVSNGRGYTLRSLVEALLQQVAELQEAVTRMKGVREAEGEQHCLLRDQTVPGPRVSTVAHAGKEAANPGKEAANPGSWEKNRFAVLQGADEQQRSAILQGTDEQQRSHQAQPASALLIDIISAINMNDEFYQFQQNTGSPAVINASELQNCL